MRVAIYARYSTDLQSEKSIPDQFRECERDAERRGWRVVAKYQDAAVSGASLKRDGIQALLRNARGYDVVLTESLDRISRDQEDIAAVYKRLTFQQVQIATLSDGGFVNEMHIGMKGTFSALFLKDLATKTRRGLRGRVEAGKSGGGLSYGYRIVRRGAEIAVGEREIAREEAAVIVRICQDYAAGMSPRAIARKLNAEGVPGPRKQWSPSTIHGHSSRGTGILNNELYVGRLVWNRQRYIKDPISGKRVSRRNPPDVVTAVNVEALRIVPDELWNAVKARQRATRQALRDGATLVNARRAKYLFSGLIKCGVCGSNYTMISKDRLACAGATNRANCTNKKSIRRDEVERRVVKAMEERLWNQELFEEFCAEFTNELNRLRGEQGGAIATARRELADVEAKATNCVNWIADNWDAKNPGAAKRMEERLESLENRHRELTATIEAAERCRASRPLLHPNMHQLYRDWVLEARDALGDADRGADAMNALRAMVQEITITPKAGELEIVLKGDLAEMLVAAGRKTDSEDLRQQVMLVAGAGFEPATFGL